MVKTITLILAILPILMITNFKNQTIEENLNPKTMKEGTEKSAIKKLLFNYRDALNESDVEQVMSLYAEQGIFMPSGAPTAIGTNQVKSAYEFVFSNIKLSIEFQIDEIEVLDNYAVVRSTSRGSTFIHATGKTIPEENRELFVLKKEENEWKIDRYMFNKMN